MAIGEQREELRGAGNRGHNDTEAGQDIAGDRGSKGERFAVTLAEKTGVCTNLTVNIAIELAMATNITFVFGDNTVHRAAWSHNGVND